MDPDDSLTIESAFAAISQRPREAALLVVRYLNTNLEVTEYRARDEDIAADMDAAGLGYLSGHFLPRHKP